MPLGLIPLPLIWQSNGTLDATLDVLRLTARGTVTPVWPSGLPLPRLPTHGFNPKPTMRRAEMDQGTARQRRRSTVTMTEIPFSFVLDKADATTLKDFIEDTAEWGAKWFHIDLVCGVGTVRHEARFKGEIEEELLGSPSGTDQVWCIKGMFEVIDRPMLSEAALDEALAASDEAGAQAVIAAYGATLP